VPLTELDVARAIRDGELPSPQKFGNVWLFDLRITGTGCSYRAGKKEFVWRDPSLYLNDEFLERCNGLAVILDHPEANMLDGAEYKKRNVGSVFLPYLRKQAGEVWAISKIYDDATAELLQTQKVSTSPAVVFSPLAAGTTEKLPGGYTFLIEDEPSLLDHVALCWLGVWDKGGPPAGVESMTEETTAPNAGEEVVDRRAKADEETSEKLDAIMDAVKGIASRVDAIEERERADRRGRRDEDHPYAAEDPDQHGKPASMASGNFREDETFARQGPQAFTARANWVSTSFPRSAALSMICCAVTPPCRAFSNSSEMMLRISGRRPRRTPREFGVTTPRSSCWIGRYVPGFLVK
jgi:colicin import membrane protein